MTHPRCSALLAACASLLAIAVDRAAEVRIVGTDLLGVEFSKALYAVTAKAEVRLTLAFDGSRPGFDELKAGRADLALIVFAPGEEFDAAVFERHAVAYHRLVVLAPAAAPVEQVMLAQLESIFGGGALNLTTWGDLGAGGAWAESSLQLHAPPAGLGLAAELFRHTVLRDRAFKPIVVRDERPGDLANAFARDSRAIVLAAVPPAPGVAAKPLAVAARPGAPAFLPTLENIHTGDYPLRLPLFVVFRPEARSALRPVLQFLFSDEAGPHFERAGIAPLPPAARRQAARALASP